MFPGDSEGLQVLEHATLLGNPSSQEMDELSKLIEPSILLLFKRMGSIPRVDLMSIFFHATYTDQDKRNAADLIWRMNCWVPHQRISARDAMNHPFLRNVDI